MTNIKFTGSVKVNFYADSYQYKEPKTMEAWGIDQLEYVKSRVKYMLERDRSLSVPAVQKETFWATFSIDGQELFDHRVSI